MLFRSTQIIIFLLALLFVYPCNLEAQVKATATISPATIGKNETAELKFMIENGRQIEQITLPPMPGFNIVSGPNQESYMESINGAVRSYIGASYLLQPKATGNFTIGAASIKVDGKTVTTNPVTIKVDNSSSGNIQNNSAFLPFGISPFDRPAGKAPFKDIILRKGENVQEKINKNIFIQVDADKKTCYVGEPIVVTYKLYTRLKSESNITKNPSFSGFSVIDLMSPGNNDYAVERFNGREYNVYTLRRSQLYPLQAGDIELETAEVENNVHFIKEEYASRQTDAFDDFFQDFAQATIPAAYIQDEKVTLQSKPVIINVKPLPEDGKPASFKGAVGNFTITAKAENDALTTDDDGKLNITLSGQGNMFLVNAPEITWPNGLEGFEAKTSEKLNRMEVPVSGEKYFQYPFSVDKKGQYTIPPTEFSFFDPTTGLYKTIFTDSVTISVTKGSGKPAAVLTDQNNKSEREKFFDTIFNNREWIIGTIALLIIIGLFTWLRRDDKKEKNNFVANEKIKPAAAEPPVQLNPLAKTQGKLLRQEGQDFYKTLNNEICFFLSGKLQIPIQEISKKKIAEETDKKEIPADTSLAIQQLLEDIQWQLYTPYNEQEKMQEVYERAMTIVSSLETITG